VSPDPAMTRQADAEHPRSGRHRLLAAGTGVVALLFVGSRVGLLVTSYDANQNWEEPVFLFSAVELQHDGLSHLFDYQDDLNHGGSLVLVLLAVPWLSIAGTSLVALKGVAIVWSTLTLCVAMAVARRYFSPRLALLLGVCLLALSPTAARLNVTLVGSHPESVLPSMLALAAYWEWVRQRHTSNTDSPGVDVALGVAGGVAVWVAYVSTMFVLPLLLLRLAFVRRRRNAIALGAGFLLGIAPWMYQNLWLRPHGALLWMQHLGAHEPGVEQVSGWGGALTGLLASFGLAASVAALLLCIACVAWAGLLAGVVWAPWRRWLPATTLVLLPLLAAPILGLALPAHAALPLYPNEGYYHYRFFVPLQMALMWVLVLGVEMAARRFGPWVTLLAAAAVLGFGAWNLWPLYGHGTRYRPDYARDRAAGCLVFGLAEWDRAGSAPAAMRRLAALSDAPCRDRAFGGLGWALGAEYMKHPDLDAARATLAAIPDRTLRWAACGGFVFVLTRAPESALPAAQRATAIEQVTAFCRPARPS